MASPKVEIKGKVVSVGEIVTSASGFTRREVVLDTASEQDKYPNPLPITFKNGRTADADALAVGDEASVDVFLNGRKWDGPNGVRFFLDLSAASKPIVAKKAEAMSAGDVRDYRSLLAFAAQVGVDEAKVKEVGVAYNKRTGIASAQYALTDWAALAADVAALKAPAPADAADEEMPF